MTVSLSGFRVVPKNKAKPFILLIKKHEQLGLQYFKPFLELGNGKFFQPLKWCKEFINQSRLKISRNHFFYS